MLWITKILCSLLCLCTTGQGDHCFLARKHLILFCWAHRYSEWQTRKPTSELPEKKLNILSWMKIMTFTEVSILSNSQLSKVSHSWCFQQVIPKAHLICDFFSCSENWINFSAGLMSEHNWLISWYFPCCHYCLLVTVLAVILIRGMKGSPKHFNILPHLLGALSAL